MRMIDTREYVSTLRELTEQGHEVSMLIAGGSMSPFLCHKRDTIFFKKKDRPLRKGDMVFYERDNGQFVMHRICRVHEGTYDLVGDAQTVIETGIREDQIFARICRVRRKEKLIDSSDFWWKFFEKVWIRMIPVRPAAQKVYGAVTKWKRRK